MPQQEPRERYWNWYSLIETDYITMFIKTWLTFLASLQELLNYNNLDNASGDSGILDEYKNNIFDKFNIRIDEEFSKNVLKAYLKAKNEVLISDIYHKRYYSRIFYKIADEFSQTFVYEYGGNKTELVLEIPKDDNEKKLKIELSDDRKKFINYFRTVIKAEINLSSEVRNSKIFERKPDFIDKILSVLTSKVQNILNNNNRLSDDGRQERLNYLNNKCLKDIKVVLIEQLDLKSIFPLRPDNAIDRINKDNWEIQNKPQGFDENLTKWFVDFSYMLRNILFHFIIDPMDENWQTLLNFTYLALKHLVNENIKILKNRGVDNDNSYL